MTLFEILQRVAENHNRIAKVYVSGDNAILVGDTIRDLRALAQELQSQIDIEQAKQNTIEE